MSPGKVIDKNKSTATVPVVGDAARPPDVQRLVFTLLLPSCRPLCGACRTSSVPARLKGNLEKRYGEKVAC